MDRCYIVQEREFINSKKNIYTIGQTKQHDFKRFQQYPKQTQIHILLKVVDCLKFEKRMMEVFDEKFICRTDLGREYYEGDITEMIVEMMNIKKDFDSKLDKEDNVVKEIDEVKQIEEVKQIDVMKEIDEIDDIMEVKKKLKDAIESNNILKEKNDTLKLGMKYSCEGCDFFTNYKILYKGHKESRKHWQFCKIGTGW
jgi:hypothetical protein